MDQRPENEGASPVPQPRIPTFSRSTTTSLSSSADFERRVVREVRIPDAKQYVPRQARPRLLPQRRPAVVQDGSSSNRVIMQRHLTEAGAALFILGTRIDGTVVRDTEDVPVSEIFNHVSVEELHRFENQEYEDEAERERIRILTTKPRGRPRKYPDRANQIIADTSPSRALAPRETLPARLGGYAAFREDGPRKRGRPKGWRKSGLPRVAVVIPSFDGPQPTGQMSGAESTPDPLSRSEEIEIAESRGQSRELESTPEETPMDIQARTGVFSMVAASRLVPIDSEADIDTSRDITPLQPMDDAIGEAPSPERIIVDSEDDAVSEDGEEVQSESSEQELFFDAPSDASIHDVDDDDLDEHEALLRQFTAHRAPNERKGPDEREALLQQFMTKGPPREKSHVSDTSDTSRVSPIKASLPTRPPQRPSANVTAPIQKPSKRKLPATHDRSYVSELSDASRVTSVNITQAPRPPVKGNPAASIRSPAPPNPPPIHTPGRSLKRKSITPHFPSRIKRSTSSKAHSKSIKGSTVTSLGSPLAVRTAQPIRSSGVPAAGKARSPALPAAHLSAAGVRQGSSSGKNVGVGSKLLTPSRAQLARTRNVPPGEQVSPMRRTAQVNAPTSAQAMQEARAISISSDDDGSETEESSSGDDFVGVRGAGAGNIDPRLVRERRRGSEESELIEEVVQVEESE